ncbi:DUF4340 domain-containing protein [uncultured Subdoligranulum sp.]|uniref:DUF4340 domain-containing protein n=1 Tax=uncultured Subdoligranulum sp. TaxID=512298 RepID=UPI002615D2D3|nr:DUF4340 domain-containing protein [uncultured Subdoligranulum sp.]
MNRQKKLAVLVGVLVALCAIIAIVSGVQKHMDTISTVDEEIFATAESALTEVSWTKDGTSLTFTQTDDTWSDASDAAFPVDQDKMTEFLEHFESVHASFIIEDVEDFGQYGLDTPSCTITFTSADGVTTLQMGDYSAMDEKRYLTLGDGTVYLIDDDLEQYIATDRDDLMRQDNIPDYDTLDGLTATGETAFTVEHHPDEALTYTDAYEYYLNENGSYKALSTTKVEDFVTTLKDLDRTDYATYTADASVLGDYGLDTPAVTFTVITTADEEQSTATLAFGKKGDNCYMRMDDSPIIYKVDADTYNDTIAAAGYDTLRPDEVLALNWDDVQSIDFTIDDTTYTVDKKGDTYQIGDDVVEFDDVSAAVDGLVVNEFNAESPSKKQEAAFTVHLDNDAFPTLTVTVYQYDGDNCLVQLDGTTLGLVSRSLVVDLTEAVNAITLGLE